MQPAVFLAAISLITASAVGYGMNVTFECSKEPKCGTNQMRVSTEHVLTPQCGENVTLTCSIDKHDEVVEYYWTYRNRTLCGYNRPTEEVSPDIHCEYKDQDLKLTIKDVKPFSNGTYSCVLKASSDHRMNKTKLSGCKGPRQRLNLNTLNADRDCASDSKCMNLLVALTALLTFVLVSGV